MVHSNSSAIPWKRIGFALLNVSVMVYFGYNVIIGDLGLLSRWRLADEVSQLEYKLDKLNQRRQQLEQKVSLVRPESLDPDMLDERARIILNFAHPNDITILRPTRLTSD
jgi:cell division protein FtsB